MRQSSVESAYVRAVLDRCVLRGRGLSSSSGEAGGFLAGRGGLRKSQDDVVAAGLVVRARDTGRVLMLQRAVSDGDPASGRWEFPGGHIEPGETPYDAAVREWSEETGHQAPEGHRAGGWRHGVYEAFIVEVPSEDAIDLNLDLGQRHVLNPDDPDGDAIEVVAWWDPAMLPGNPAVREELLESAGRWKPLLLKRGAVPASLSERIFNRSFALLQVPVRKTKENCGANAPGGGGFQPGNTCASGDGSGKDSAEIQKQVDKFAAGQLLEIPSGEREFRKHVAEALLDKYGSADALFEHVAMIGINAYADQDGKAMRVHDQYMNFLKDAVSMSEPYNVAELGNGRRQMQERMFAALMRRVKSGELNVGQLAAVKQKWSDLAGRHRAHWGDVRHIQQVFEDAVRDATLEELESHARRSGEIAREARVRKLVMDIERGQFDVDSTIRSIDDQSIWSRREHAEHRGVEKNLQRQLKSLSESVVKDSPEYSRAAGRLQEERTRWNLAQRRWRGEWQEQYGLSTDPETEREQLRRYISEGEVYAAQNPHEADIVRPVVEQWKSRLETVSREQYGDGQYRTIGEMDLPHYEVEMQSPDVDVDTVSERLIMNSRYRDPQNLVLLAGVGANANVRIQVNDDMDAIILSGKDGYENQRRIYEQNGEPVIYNEYFEVEETGQGLGSAVFASQVRAAREAGFKRIETVAARSEKYNGYYSWPRMGYDAVLPEYMAEEASAYMGEPVTMVSDLFETEEGRDWWKENGREMKMTFDLRDGSLSMERFEAYMRAKGI